MSITAEIIKDSISTADVRITTFILKYPRFIHSEFMTHRMFSRNASSSRAIPFEKQLKLIEEDLAYPLDFRKNKKGMQAGEVLSQEELPIAQEVWYGAAKSAIRFAKKLHKMEVHKQYVNRILEPFSHISVICTATSYDNFFALRHHSAAQPEMQELAAQMWKEYRSNAPEIIPMTAWHLPFVNTEDMLKAWDIDRFKCKPEELPKLIKQSVACCARVSYLNHDKTIPTQEQNEVLYNRLLGEQPIHASPAEHQAKAVGNGEYCSGNFRGWIQFRKTLDNENTSCFNGPIG